MNTFDPKGKKPHSAGANEKGDFHREDSRSHRDESLAPFMKDRRPQGSSQGERESTKFRADRPPRGDNDRPRREGEPQLRRSFNPNFDRDNRLKGFSPKRADQRAPYRSEDRPESNREDRYPREDRPTYPKSNRPFSREDRSGSAPHTEGQNDRRGGGFRHDENRGGGHTGGFRKEADREGGYRTGTDRGGFRKEGADRGGYKSGENREGGYRTGADRGGFRKEGADRGGYKSGENREGGYRTGADRGGFRKEGADRGGYKSGENREGGYRTGADRGGFRKEGADRGGYKSGENREGGYRTGADRGGFRKEGADRGGYKSGENREGGYRTGADRGGFRKEGADRGGYKSGENREGGYRTGTDRGGFRKEGADRGSGSGARPGGRPFTPGRGHDKENYPRFEPSKTIGAVRLNRFIANSGICSRREADELISAGVVAVNGVVVTELGTKVTPNDEIRFNGEVIKGEKKVYILMNKPRGYVTTMEDPHADKTVMDLIKDACTERVYPVGRLDKNSVGVLLFTNDGELTRQLTHPSYSKKKIYQVTLDKAVTQADLQRLADGIELEDGVIFADEVSYVGDSKKEVGIEIHSGRNRIVRRMFESMGYNVQKLDRVYFGGLTKKMLKRGGWRFLTPLEVSRLKSGEYV